MFRARNFATILSALFILYLYVGYLLAGTSESREWESLDGKFKVTAKFKEYLAKENNVILVKVDGKEVTVPMGKLSKKDQDFVKNNISEADNQKDLNQKPIEKKEQ